MAEVKTFELLVDEQGCATKGQESGLKAVVDRLAQVEVILSQMQIQLNEVRAKVDNVTVGKLILANDF